MPEVTQDKEKYIQIFCTNCYKRILKSAGKCPHCGAPNRQTTASYPAAGSSASNISGGGSGVKSTVSDKNRATYILLAIFLGMAGIHNFYAGYNKFGLIQLILTLTGFLIPLVVVWVILDIICTSTDGNGKLFT